AVEETGKVLEAPHPLTPPRGPQALVRLVPPAGPAGPAFIAWENLLERPSVGRTLHVAEVTSAASLGQSTATIAHAVSDGSIPELSAMSSGLAALVLAPACRAGGVCRSERAVPTYVELDRQLDVAVSEPV